MEPVSIYVGDGYLHISETAECRYYVEYENRLAPVSAVTNHNFETLQMLISRGYGDEPDTLVIFDTLTKASYSVTVPDRTTGRTCVPWPLLG